MKWYCRECLNPIMTFDSYEEALKHVDKTGHGIWKDDNKG